MDQQIATDQQLPPDALGLATAFWHGFIDAVRRPVAGAEQLLGNRAAGDRFFETEAANKQLGTAGIKSAGALLGNAALFLGATTAVQCIPGLGRLAPILTGLGLGFLQPVKETDSAAARLINAVLAPVRWRFSNMDRARCTASD
jgi:hypothetical protein